MKAKAIRSEKDCETALTHIESLMDASANSSKAEKLELWSLLVEKYEEEHYPITTPDPVKAIYKSPKNKGGH